MNAHTCLAVLGGYMLFMAWVFDGSDAEDVSEVLDFYSEEVVFAKFNW